MFIAKDTHFSLSACVLRPAGARYGKLYATDKGCRCYRSNKLNYHSGTRRVGSEVEPEHNSVFCTTFGCERSVLSRIARIDSNKRGCFWAWRSGCLGARLGCPAKEQGSKAVIKVRIEK